MWDFAFFMTILKSITFIMPGLPSVWGTNEEWDNSGYLDGATQIRSFDIRWVDARCIGCLVTLEGWMLGLGHFMSVWCLENTITLMYKYLWVIRNVSLAFPGDHIRM